MPVDCRFKFYKQNKFKLFLIEIWSFSNSRDNNMARYLNIINFSLE